MKFNYRASLGFLIILTAFLAALLAIMSYVFVAITATVWTGQYFHLSGLTANLLGIGVFLVLPVTILAGFVGD